jgi:hypothetical protein
MSKKVIFMFVLSAFLMTMCRTYASEPTSYTNGLSCNNYTDRSYFEWRGEEYKYYIREEGADCSYTCPDGTTHETNISGTISSLYSASQADLDAQFCGVALAPTPTEAPLTEPPTPEPSPTLAATPTAAASPTSAESPTPLASAVAAITSPTAQVPVTSGTSAVQGSLLTGRVTMCDTGGNLISFRITQPPPDLTGKELTALISDQLSICYVNATNPSVMTCALPPGIVFPAPIIVNVDGEMASSFTYDGLGCADITTPVATTTP